MTLDQFLERLAQGHTDFEDTLQVIHAHYEYRPVEFRNGIGEQTLVNPPGVNEGSCKIFAFAQLHALDEQQTLQCFGRFYREDVLNNPHGSDHANIRNFIKYGWIGIEFDAPPLHPKSPPAA